MAARANPRLFSGAARLLRTRASLGARGLLRSRGLLGAGLLLGATVLWGCGGDDPTAPPAVGGTGGQAGSAGASGSAGVPSGGSGGTTTPQLREVCSADGWCWENPLPQGNDLLAVDATSDLDVWAVGEAGTLIHYDGLGWAQVPSVTWDTLRAVWARNDGTAVAVGDYGLMLEGSSARLELSPVAAEGEAPFEGMLYGVHGAREASVDELLLVGDNGAAFHRDGQGSFKRLPLSVTSTLRAVRVLADGSAWIVGDGGVAFRRPNRAGAFARVDLGTTADLSAVVEHAGQAAIGARDGATWLVGAGAPQSLPALDGEVVGLASTTESGGDSVLWSALAGGMAARRTDGDWTALPVGGDWPLRGACAVSEGVLVGGDSGGLVLFRGTERTAISSGVRGSGLAFGSADGKSAFLVGDDALQLVSGRWASVTLPTARALYGVHLLANEGWAVGTGGTVLRWSAGEWTDQSLDADTWLRAVWSDGKLGVIVGQGGAVLERSGSGDWKTVSSGVTADLYAVWGSGGAVWVAGANGTVLQRGSSGAWAPLADPKGVAAGVSFRAIHGTSSTDVWFTGSAGKLVHYDGKALVDRSAGTGYTVTSVHAVSPKLAWAVGTSGVILNWDGTRWSERDSGTLKTLDAVFTDAAGTTWAAGVDGVLLRRRP